jgi:peptidoglycan DL-endopeptidase CwlO
VPSFTALRRPLNLFLIVAFTFAAFAAATVASSGSTRVHAATITFRQKAVQIASYQKGDPYRYGAAGPNAFDCSGLTMYSYKQVGVWLPHNAESQYYRTWHIAKRSKRPGDLLFYTSNGRGSGIYHVAIYAGNGYQWAAPHTGTVVKKQRIYSSRYLVGRVHR